MKVLQLCIKPPFPPVDGGTMAMHSITQGLLDEGCEVRVLSMCSDKHKVQHDKMTEQYKAATRFEAIEIDLSIHKLDAFMALMCGESYHVKRFISRRFEQRLIEILEEEEFDLIHIESIFLTPYLPAIHKYSEAKVVLRAHNVEHQIWRRIADQTPNPFKRWYLKKLALALRMYELEHLNKYDGIACITKEDADYFRTTPSPEGHKLKRPIIVLPFGIEVPQTEEVPVKEASLYHLGAMDWMPNEESVRWFLDNVWHRLHQELPQTHLYLAGRKMPSDLLTAHIDGVTIEGEVPDANAFVADKQINVVPLHSGSGLRIKIIEAMAMGKVVITTTVGAQGIEYTDGVQLLIANTPDEFVQQIRRCLEDEDLRNQISTNARLLVQQRYSRKPLAQELISFYNTLL